MTLIRYSLYSVLPATTGVKLNFIDSAETTIRGGSGVLPANQASSHVGLYRWIIDEVVDEHGCRTNYKQAVTHTAPMFDVHIAQEPALVVDRREISCVGDTWDFYVDAHEHWRIEYTYANVSADGSDSVVRVMDSVEYKQNRVKQWVSSHVLAYLVDSPGSAGISRHRIQVRFLQPGRMQIKSVCHVQLPAGNKQSEFEDQPQDQHWCCQKDVPLINHVAHPIPTVKLNAGSHGSDVIREGHQSQTTLAFTGTPPFAVTYVRRSPQTGRVLDSYSLAEIHGYEHALTVDQGGTFQVTSIQDKYCRYPAMKT
jgi:hypothetical protein